MDNCKCFLYYLFMFLLCCIPVTFIVGLFYETFWTIRIENKKADALVSIVNKWDGHIAASDKEDDTVKKAMELLRSKI